VLEVEHERLLKYRFATGTLDTAITWQLIPENGGARLRLIHEKFNLDSSLGRKALEGMKPGWPKIFARDSKLYLKDERSNNRCRNYGRWLC
jgi:uncharacterized protein YndB with AHSA1/START domain